MQIEHKTEKGTVLFILLPVNTDYPTFKRDFDVGRLKHYKKDGWQLIGLTSDITEEMAKMMVEAKHNLKYADRNDLTGYRSYGELHKDGKPYWLSKALDSFKSLMQHLRVYEVNPYEKPYVNFMGSDVYSTSFMQLEKWKEINERVGKWILLFKAND